MVSAQHRGVFIAAAGIFSGFWVALALGFRLHDQPIPVELRGGLLPAALVFIAAVTIGLHVLWQRRSIRVRNELDPPHSTLYCTACQSRLWLVHAGEAKPETPTFPANG